MSENAKKIICWLPRILGLVFAAFLLLFSFDVFDEFGGWKAVVPFLIHSLPSLIVLAVVLVSWKRKLAGAIFFAGFSVWYVWSVGWGKPFSWYLLIAGPALLIAVLFFVDWRIKKDN